MRRARCTTRGSSHDLPVPIQSAYDCAVTHRITGHSVLGADHAVHAGNGQAAPNVRLGVLCHEPHLPRVRVSHHLLCIERACHEPRPECRVRMTRDILRRPLDGGAGTRSRTCGSCPRYLRRRSSSTKSGPGLSPISNELHRLLSPTRHRAASRTGPTGAVLIGSSMTSTCPSTCRCSWAVR